MRLVLATVACLLAVPAASTVSRHPRLRLLDTSPAVVSGVGFAGRERVAVTVRDGSVVLAKHVRSTEHGAFVARFSRALSGGECAQYVVTARGSRGDHAAWKSPPRACGTPLQPVDQ